MPRFTNPNPSRRWSLIAGIAVVAAAAWASYAWKSTDDPNAAGLPSPPLSANAVRSAQPGNEESGPPLTSLRATIPAEARDRAAELPSIVQANSPASIGGPIEITIPESRPIEMALPFTPTPTEPRSSGGRIESAAAAVSAGRQALARGDQVTARTLLSRALDRGLPALQAQRVRSELTRLADAMLFSRATGPDDPVTGTHIISRGETIHAVAGRYKITDQLLCAINNITDPNRVQAEARLKVIHGPFHAVIWKSQHRLDVYLQSLFVRSFHVGLGTNGGTPLGQWIISNKLMNPAWTDPRNGHHYLADDPDNPIGERWIGLDCVAGDCLGRVGFGIHGTIDPQSIGANMSMGCIRLVPEDVVLLYNLLVTRHSRVEIRP